VTVTRNRQRIVLFESDLLREGMLSLKRKDNLKEINGLLE
jgi:hypothetical protein